MKDELEFPLEKFTAVYFAVSNGVPVWVSMLRPNQLSLFQSFNATVLELQNHRAPIAFEYQNKTKRAHTS